MKKDFMNGQRDLRQCTCEDFLQISTVFFCHSSRLGAGKMFTCGYFGPI